MSKPDPAPESLTVRIFGYLFFILLVIIMYEWIQLIGKVIIPKEQYEQFRQK